MSCPEPLQERQNEEKKDDAVISTELSSENGSNFKNKTTLGSLHYLISECTDILEDAEDLLGQCYYDQKGLLEILALNSRETLVQFIKKTLPNWYDGIKETSNFKRILTFTKQFAKDGKILASLKFLLILKKEYALLFTRGSTSFDKLQGCYEAIVKFEKELTAKSVFLGVETDALILWVGENQAAIKASENIVMPDLADFEEELYCNSKSIQTFIEDLNFFCNDLKQRLIRNMLVQIDDAARVQNLCSPNNAITQNKEVLLLEVYSQDPVLREKLNYLSSNCGINVAASLEKFDKSFQDLIIKTKTIDSSLGKIKRISYLSQALDPRFDFSPGFCAGDSRNWCQNMLNGNYEQSSSGCLIDHFTTRQKLHSEILTDKIFWLQIKFGLDQHEASIYISRVSTAISDSESAKNFCIDILELLRKEALQNMDNMAFEVILHKKQSDESAHQISFYRFFRNEKEIWRIRDLNYGEFEGNFTDLKEWYSKLFSTSIYVKSLQYDNAVLKKSIVFPKKTNTCCDGDEQYRSYIQKNMSIAFYYSLFSDDLYEEILKLHQRIICPTIKDNLIENLVLFAKCKNKLFSNPNKAFLELGLILSQVLVFENVQCQTIKNLIQIARLIALFNAGRMNELEINFKQALPSIKPELLESEDAAFLNFVRDQYLKTVDFGSMLTKEEKLKHAEVLKEFGESLKNTRTTIGKILTELTLTDLRNKGTLRKLCVLLDCYTKKCASIICEEEIFRNATQFKATGLQEERLHSLIEKAMDVFLNELTQVQTPQPLTFMKTLQSEMYNQKWVPEIKSQNQLAECKKYRYCPGVVDTP